MKAKHRCLICKYQGINKTSNIFSNLIYRSGMGPIELNLCYSHSVEYFKLGQVKFFKFYAYVFEDRYGSEEDQVVLKFIRQNNTDHIQVKAKRLY